MQIAACAATLVHVAYTAAYGQSLTEPQTYGAYVQNQPRFVDQRLLYQGNRPANTVAQQATYQDGQNADVVQRFQRNGISYLAPRGARVEQGGQSMGDIQRPQMNFVEPPNAVFQQAAYQDGQNSDVPQRFQPGNPVFQQAAYQDGQNMDVDQRFQRGRINYFTPKNAPGKNFLGVSSDLGHTLHADSDVTSVLSHLTDAVRQQSQALMALQTQEAELEAHEAAFEAQEARLHHGNVGSSHGNSGRRKAPPCWSFNKNGAVPVINQPSCDQACSTAEGYVLYGNDFNDIILSNGTVSGGTCDCINAYGSRLTLCTDAGAVGVRTTMTLVSLIVLSFALGQI